MKKLGIAVLAAAGMVAASGVFAQEIKFDGYINAGLGLVFSTENEAGAAGAFLRLQSQGGVNAIFYQLLTIPLSVFDNRRLQCSSS